MQVDSVPAKTPRIRTPREVRCRALAPLIAIASALLCAVAAQPVGAAATPSTAISSEATKETAVLAGGCFWGVQAVFQHVKGVTSAVSGYAGGTLSHPSYEEVSSGETGHAESVEITFDPKQISYPELLRVFFSVAHDPTQLNRQGPDSGTQYRSAIFTTSNAQQQTARTVIAELDKAHAFAGPIVTQVAPLQSFYPAEAYHQNYATLHPESAYIARYDLPKLDELKTKYPVLFRDRPVLVGANER
jgi:peptide-methionine (S)-S-oxide reductase